MFGAAVVCSITRAHDAGRGRNAFFRACGIPSDSDFTSLQGTATIRGVGFFDTIHGQRGVAPNGIELHPVLSFTATSCSSTGATLPATREREPIKPAPKH